MKTFLALLLCLACAHADEKRNYVAEATTYDAFKDLYCYDGGKFALVMDDAKGLQVTSTISLSLMGAGKVPRSSDPIGFLFDLASTSHFLDDDHDVVFLIDGQRSPVQKASYSASAIGDKLHEYVSFDLPLETLKLIAQGKDVKLGVGPCHFALTSGQLDLWKTFAADVESQPK